MPRCNDEQFKLGHYLALRKEGIMKRDLVLGVFSLAALLGNLAWAASASDDAAQRLSNSANVLKEVANARDRGIPALALAGSRPQPLVGTRDCSHERHRLSGCYSRPGIRNHDSESQFRPERGRGISYEAGKRARVR